MRARRALESEPRQRRSGTRKARNYQAEDWADKSARRQKSDVGKIRLLRSQIDKAGGIRRKKEPLPIDFAEKPDRNDPHLVSQGKLKKHWDRLLRYFKERTVDNPE